VRDRSFVGAMQDLRPYRMVHPALSPSKRPLKKAGCRNQSCIIPNSMAVSQTLDVWVDIRQFAILCRSMPPTESPVRDSP
jgi:hypothetical protein